MTKTTLLLVRHGETEWNAAGRVQGHTNSDLTARGQAQAAAVARLLSAPPIGVEWAFDRPTALYASDLGRAVQTALPIGEALGLSPTLDPALREMHFGELEGLSWEELEARHPEAAQRLWGDEADAKARAPGGESRFDMHERSYRALEAIARAHPAATTAAVAHGGVIGFFLRAVLGVPFHLWPGYTLPNGSVAAFDFDGTRFRLLTWGLVPSP